MFPHTALKCFTAVARHHGVDLTVERLAHDYALGATEPETEKLLRIAQENGFRAKRIQLDWDGLTRLPVADFPLLLRLGDGNTIAAVRYRADTGELFAADPLYTGPGQVAFTREALGTKWSGEAILLRR